MATNYNNISDCPFIFFTQEDRPDFQVAKKEWFNNTDTVYGRYGELDDDQELYEDELRYTYWDGNNWRTVFLDELNIYGDETHISDMWEAIDNKEYDRESGTSTVWSYGDYEISQTRWASDWVLYSVIEKRLI